MEKFYISEINIYPIKSLGCISLQEANLDEKGLQYDRRWMLIDENGDFITQRKHFELSLLKVKIENERLIVTHKKNPKQTISFSLDEQIGEAISVRIWDDITIGFEVNNAVSKWFSDFMKLSVRLIKMPEEEKRLVDPRYASANEIVSFADGYPCLLIGQSALDNLNKKLKTPILMDRFRPNFVFSGGEPHIEDNFATFNIGNVLFSAVKPCARCVLITIDQQTGIKGQEPLRTLATYRTKNNKIMFGQNLIHQGLGTIKLGDELKITKWKS